MGIACVDTSIIKKVECAAQQQRITIDASQRAVLRDVSTGAELALRAGTGAAYFVYGPSGRGKTWLMSQIYAALAVPESAKSRVHFHTFFQEFQQNLIGQASSKRAIEATVAQLLDGTRVFLFDELHVHDPGAAALLNRLLHELVLSDALILITSNYVPEGLLPNRVYHHVVEPGIRTIREHFQVHSMDAGRDYREQESNIRAGFASGHWLVKGTSKLPDGIEKPNDADTQFVLQGHRRLQALAVSGKQISFEFAKLLEHPTAARDYLELAEQYTHWVLYDVPALAAMSRAARARLVTLVDVLSDKDIRLTVVAHTTLDRFTDGAELPADFFRTRSRLALLSGV